jgi:hypothetical protein
MAMLFIDGFGWAGASVTHDEFNVDILRFYDARVLPTGSGDALATTRGSFKGIQLDAANTNYISTIDLQDGTTGSLVCVIGFYIKTPAVLSGPAQWWRVYNGPFIQCDLLMNTGGTVTFRRGAGTALGTSTFTFAGNTEYYVEFEATVGDSPNGSLVMKVADLTSDDNAETSIEFTVSGVDTRVLGTAWTDVRIYGLGLTTYVDDLYIDDADLLGNLYVETLETTGAGTDTDWTPSAGSNYAAVDDTPSMDDDTTYNETTTATDSDLYAMGTIATAGTILGVQVSAGVRVTTGSDNVRLQVREGTTTGEGVDQAISSTSYVGIHEMFLVNPDTSAGWEDAEIAAMESGIKFES